VRVRRRGGRRRLSAALAAGLVAATALVVGAPVGQTAASAVVTAAETFPVPDSGTFRLSGHGLGHGIGMSQFGAEGMGRQGKTYRQVLSFYYPGTRLVRADAGTTLRVALSGYTRTTAAGATVVLAARPGLRLRAGGRVLTVPGRVAGAELATLRVVRRADGLTVRADSAQGSTVVGSGLGAVSVASASRVRRSRVALVAPGGATRTYHGRLTVLRCPSGLLLVDQVALDQYAAAVVAHEVPSSWTPTALRAQAVAARSYALLLRGIARGSGQRYDICDTTSCQTMGSIESVEPVDTAAARATSLQYLQSQGLPVLAMFSAADGGWTVDGSRPYLVAREDPYDGVVIGAANWGHDWERTVSAAAVTDAYPALGRLTAIRVDGRDGNGAWGGRVERLSLVGSRSSVTLTGDAFRWAFGLPSTWWTVTNAGTTATLAPAPRAVRAVPLDRAVRVAWRRPATRRVVTGYQVTVRPGAVRRVVRPTAGRPRQAVTIRGLVNGVAYRSQVRAVYRSGATRTARAAAVVPSSRSSYFRAVTPATLMSARSLPSLGDGGRRVLQAAGRAGIPVEGTRAVVLRVSATGSRRSEVLAWRPGARGRLTAALVARRSPGTGTVVVPVDDAGRVALGATSGLHSLRVDVVGFYTASGVGSQAFHALPAAPVADTRVGLGVPRRRLADGSTTWVSVAGRAGVPRGATTVLVNATLRTQGSAARLSTAAPSRAFSDGLVVGAPAATSATGSALVSLDSRGRLPVRVSGGPAAVTVDVLGWFGPHGVGPGGRFRPAAATVFTAPAAGPMAPGEAALVPVTAVSGIPATARAVMLEVRAFAAATTGRVSLRPAGSAVPRRPAIVCGARRPSHNVVVVPVGRDGQVEVTAGGDAVDVTVRVVGWYS
jgi:SpoIID/LytB domain protein